MIDVEKKGQMKNGMYSKYSILQNYQQFNDSFYGWYHFLSKSENKYM